ncbi:IQ calmodulin-binding motif protein (macronuclear) [Tetrahymena thermophila SB210]|uniref:IQ calmodulin-binding motif protein n=1 Tax=Tetrahymena thermophila (strain SB210) TaxID=312017 RepID=I7M2Y8_TETTS|nr:IQ calmodulin-binding motif protein [Tetrahymena thermophila SB210]EAS01643.2 IQ calmodulin-binding motif protein [Tetrahymena thermophila SB210]|eukprot:XP_001021888.2 IQ calmodulin-binding motif protein [Tetrahymena thermophila SB210]
MIDLNLNDQLNILKIQAFFRGFLVRKQICTQAKMEMQYFMNIFESNNQAQDGDRSFEKQQRIQSDSQEEFSSIEQRKQYAIQNINKIKKMIEVLNKSIMDRKQYLQQSQIY